MKKIRALSRAVASAIASAAIAAAMIMAAAIAACRTEPEIITLTGITITAPAKITYDQNEQFDSTGLTVTAHFSDGTTGTPTSDIALSWNGQTIADGNTAVTAQAGYKDIAVSWRDKTAGFTLAVDITHISSPTQWNAAIAEISGDGNGKSYALSIDANIAVTPSYPTFGSAADLTVTLVGAGTLSLSAAGRLFYLQGSSPEAKQTLIIDGDVTLQGMSGNSYSVVEVSAYAVLDMRKGTITGNTLGAYDDGGGVMVYGGSFIMSGGTISGNTAGNYGGGVFVQSGSFTMSGGDISGNTLTGNSYGGGVFVGGSGSFTMSGGNIINNTASSGGSGAGGGVCVGGNGSFDMSGGVISGNTAGYGGGYGGGVMVQNSGAYGSHSSFDMSGGVISGNTATSGGGVYVDRMTGGSGNLASFSKTDGGIIYGDTDTTHTPGSTDNTATDITYGQVWGHAVFYDVNGSNRYYRNATLGAGADGNISTDTLPTLTGADNTEGNWIKQ